MMIVSDIKECDAADKGGCTHTCVEEVGSYHCECQTGYQLAEDKKTCKGERCEWLIIVKEFR